MKDTAKIGSLQKSNLNNFPLDYKNTKPNTEFRVPLYTNSE